MARLSQTRAYIILALIATLWGSYPAFAKLALVDLPPFLLVFLRMCVASVFLGFLYLRRTGPEARAITLDGLRSFAWLGLSGTFVSAGFTYFAIYLTTASNAVILQAATPAIVAVGR
ncbi:MAG: EamA family transporter [Candidatus Methylomirabilia bacterium]